MRPGELLRRAHVGVRRLAALALLAVVPWSAGCGGSCDLDCEPTGGPAPVEATVVSEGREVVRFRIGAAEVDVRVTGDATALHEGRTYLVPLRPGEGVAPATAALPTGCSCRSVITELDGAAVETGDALPAGLRRVSVAVLGGFAAVVVLWGGLRWARGRPLF